MPKRTNLFQDVVAIIHAHMAGDAEVEESAELEDGRTGELREVDVVIRSRVAGHDVLVKSEASARGRKADQPWVDMQLGKHEDLPGGTLVLVSEAGFTGPARALAKARGAIPLEPRDLTDDDPTFQVVNALKSLWPKVVELKVEKAGALVIRPSGERTFVSDVPEDLFLYFEDGRVGAIMLDLFRALWFNNVVALTEQLAIQTANEDTAERYFMMAEGEVDSFSVEVGGAARPLLLHYEDSDPPEMHRLVAVEFHGRATITVSEIPLTHRQLGKVTYAFGEGKVGDDDALIVVTEDESGGKASLRFRQQ